MQSEPSAVTWTSLTSEPGVIVERMARGEVRLVTFFGRTIGTVRRLERLRKGAAEDAVLRDGWTVTTETLRRTPRELREIMVEKVLVFRRYGTAEAVIEGVRP